jgi:hypothetical protein
MTRTTSARAAGYAFLLYIALGISAMVLFGRATRGEGIAAQLATVALHASDVRIAAVLTLFCSFCAVVLGVTLWAITRDEDPDLAMLGLVFRVGEGVIGGMAIERSMGLLWLATATGSDAPDSQSAHALGAFLLDVQSTAGAIFFGVGSLFFSWLLLRGRMIPTALAWLGLVASILWVVGLPLQLAGVLPDAATWFIYIPMAAFEIPLALWFIFKGVRAPRRAAHA